MMARAACGAATDTDTLRLGLEELVRRAAYQRLRALLGTEPHAQDVPRRREIMAPSVRKWRTHNSLKCVVRRIEPPCRYRAGKLFHRNRHSMRDRRIDNGQKTFRCPCRRRVIIVPNVAAVSESPVSCGQQGVSLVRNKIIPRNRCHQRLEISKLSHALSVQM